MLYQTIYRNIGGFSSILMSSDGEYLTGLCFFNTTNGLKDKINSVEKDLPIFRETNRWLDLYFSGEVPNFTPKYKITNLTPFRQEVINIMNCIPFGETITYGEISEIIANHKGIRKMSAQAVGSAVGWNPICIIIPCHRVVGSNGNLIGYSGGLKNKAALLAHERNQRN